MAPEGTDAEPVLFVDCAADSIDAVHAHLKKYKLRSKVQVLIRSRSTLLALTSSDSPR
jgi:folate-binding Fe-S cluster repair protein YgfZ